MNRMFRMGLNVGANYARRKFPQSQWTEIKPSNTHFITVTASKCLQTSCYLFKSSKHVKLLDNDGTMIGDMTLTEAKEVASKDNMSLVMISKAADSSNLDVYKFEPDKTKKKIKKHKLTINSKISDHDMHVKLKHIAQWVEKGCEVKVAIKTLDNEKAATRLFKQVCKAVEPYGQLPKAQTFRHEIIAFIAHRSAAQKSHQKEQKLLTNEELKGLNKKL